MPIRFLRDQTVIAEVPCYRGLNLLGHAQLEELETGSRCGGHGVCGGDRVRIPASVPHAALSAATEIERRHLGDEALALGYRLACQCFPEADELKIEVVLLSSD